jgi:hypothetical protein
VTGSGSVAPRPIAALTLAFNLAVTGGPLLAGVIIAAGGPQAAYAMAILQLATPDELRGRLNGVFTVAGVVALAALVPGFAGYDAQQSAA